MASATAPSDVTDGPVLTLINKRIRNLKKKLNKISQLEESVAQGKSAVKNKEQEELLKSKPSIVAAVDELERFRQPLSVAVDEEIALALALDNKQSQVQPSESNNNEVVTDSGNVTETLGTDGDETASSVDVNQVIEDLLKLIYVGSMFDVKSQSDFNSIIMTRTHERNCCLTYDYVTDDDAAVMLGESDLDLISQVCSLLISRPVDSSFSHKNALERCVEHAKLWLDKSEQAIDLNSSVSYAALREKLTKIIGSEFFKITPQFKTTTVVAAEAAGNYAFQVPVQVESTDTPQEQTEDNSIDFQRNETHEDQSSPVEVSLEHEPEAENSIESQAQVEQGETDAVGTDYKEQYAPRRSYQNQRGGSRGNGNSGGRGGRGYGGGRGGRSGGRGGFYQNGRNQYHEQPGNYYPSNQRSYYGGRGRGGRGNGGGGNDNGNGDGYNHHGSGVQVAES